MAVTPDVTKESAAVFLHASDGEFLLHRIVVNRGTRAVFTLVDGATDVLLLSSENDSVSNDPLTYERKWPLPADKVAVGSSHTLGMQFPPATEYTYIVERHGESSETLIDIHYTSDAPDDWFFQSLSVTTR